jgi:hypothetical protein
MGNLEVGIEVYILVCWVSIIIAYTKITKPEQEKKNKNAL